MVERTRRHLINYSYEYVDQENISELREISEIMQKYALESEDPWINSLLMVAIPRRFTLIISIEYDRARTIKSLRNEFKKLGLDMDFLTHRPIVGSTILLENKIMQVAANENEIPFIYHKMDKIDEITEELL